MSIRLATLADIPAMMAMERDAPGAAHWSQKQYELATNSQQRVTLVFAQESVVRAFLVLRLLPGEWEIENLVVAAASRRQGFAAALVAEAIHRALSQKAQIIFLEVRESNQAARALYEKSGFVQFGSRKNYYRDPQENALLYQLTLD